MSKGGSLKNVCCCASSNMTLLFDIKGKKNSAFISLIILTGKELLMHKLLLFHTPFFAEHFLLLLGSLDFYKKNSKVFQ